MSVKKKCPYCGLFFNLKGIGTHIAMKHRSENGVEEIPATHKQVEEIELLSEEIKHLRDQLDAQRIRADVYKEVMIEILRS